MDEFISGNKADEELGLAANDGFRAEIVQQDPGHPGLGRSNALVVSFRSAAHGIDKNRVLDACGDEPRERARLGRNELLATAICRFLNAQGSFWEVKDLADCLESHFDRYEHKLCDGWDLLATSLVVHEDLGPVAEHIFWKPPTEQAIVFCEDVYVERSTTREIAERLQEQDDEQD